MVRRETVEEPESFKKRKEKGGGSLSGKGRTRGDLQGVAWSSGNYIKMEQNGKRSNKKHSLLGLAGGQGQRQHSLGLETR